MNDFVSNWGEFVVTLTGENAKQPDLVLNRIECSILKRSVSEQVFESGVG